VKGSDARLGLRVRRDAVAVLLRFAVAVAGFSAAAACYRYGLGWTRRPDLLSVVVATVFVAWALRLSAESAGRARVAATHRQHRCG
jgi:hypothetical protein